MTEVAELGRSGSSCEAQLICLKHDMDSRHGLTILSSSGWERLGRRPLDPSGWETWALTLPLRTRYSVWGTSGKLLYIDSSSGRGLSVRRWVERQRWHSQGPAGRLDSQGL